MFGEWHAIIQFPNLQFFTVFTVSKDNDQILIGIETEPAAINTIVFNVVQSNENLLVATGMDSDSQSYDMVLTFHGDELNGTLTLPDRRVASFRGGRGRTSLADDLQRYGTKSIQENRYWKAKWIWDVVQPEANLMAEHHLVFFRRAFFISDDRKLKLTLDVTADSRYRLFVNGRSIVVGPCKGDRNTQYYETVDVSDYLISGRNVLAISVLHYPSWELYKKGEGGPKSVWRSQLGGLFVEGSLRDENNMELIALHSGSEWRAFRHSGYRHVPKALINWMGGVEEVDGTGTVQGWQYPGFDDTEWKQAIPFALTRGYTGGLSPWQLTPRPIPFMYEQERAFVKVTNMESCEIGHAEKLLRGGTEPVLIAARQSVAIELDAGELTTGYLTVGVRGGRESMIRILSSECYESQDSTTAQRRKGNREDSRGKLIGEFDVYRVAGQATKDLEEVYEPFWFRTFRYVRLEIETGEEPLELIYVKYRETGYPLEEKAQFQSSDHELNSIWDLSVRTLKRCMHETYEDCPYYEQLQYLMDSRLMMIFTYYFSGDDRMARRTIADFYRSRQPSGMLQARFPSVEPQIIPSFSLYWVDMLVEHYEFNGDLELLKTYRPAVIELLDWFHERLTEEGIVGVTSNRYWSYFDWVNAWPLGTPPESMSRPMLQLSLMYAAGLRKAAKIMHFTGWNDVAADLIERADLVCHAVHRLGWSEERQLYRELPDTEIYSQHMQIMAVLSGTITGEEAKELMGRALREPIHRVTLPYSYQLFQALKATDLQDHSFGLWDRWRVFAAQGLTTLPETEVNPRSDCHAWSAVPLAEFSASILGVTPAEPGFSVVRIDPQIGKLEWAKGSVATVKGMIEVDWRLEENYFKLSAKVPEGVTALVKLPDGSEQTFTNEATFQVVVL